MRTYQEDYLNNEQASLKYFFKILFIYLREGTRERANKQGEGQREKTPC